MTKNAKQDKGQHDQPPSAVSTGQGIHVVAKPIGPICNLNCEYCFYLEKQALFATDEKYRMSDKILSAFIRQITGVGIRRGQGISAPALVQGMRSATGLSGRMPQTSIRNNLLR